MSNQAVINHLNTHVANATVFYQKLRHFHWAVTGPDFFDLHEKFEELYDKWAEHIDTLAERVRQLDGQTLATLSGVLDQATLAEQPKTPEPKAMVVEIADDLRAMTKRFLETIEAAEEVRDRTTANLMDDMLDQMGEDTWMLDAWAKKK